MMEKLAMREKWDQMAREEVKEIQGKLVMQEALEKKDQLV